MVTGNLELARLSLSGLSIGDAFGESFFKGSKQSRGDRIEARELPASPWLWSDDTAMALSVYRCLTQSDTINPHLLARYFGEQYEKEPGRGYGPGARKILSAIQAGTSWVTASREAFGGMGSMGNGAAMRAGPIGAFLGGKAFDREVAFAIYQNALHSALPTHAHPEAQAGAIAVATAAYAAATTPNAAREADLLRFVAANTPESATRAGLVKAAALSFDLDTTEAVLHLGNGSKVTSPDTVPFALWNAARHLDNFEEAMWATISGGGDMDTNCAIVGSIVSVAVGWDGIPSKWLQRREPINAQSGYP